MPDRNFEALRSELLESGIAPRHVRRIIGELTDHLEDLRLEAMRQGLPKAEADALAIRRIGDQQVIARRMLQQADCRAWVYRYPRIARFYLPMAYALLLPAAPVFAAMANSAIVVRWGTALMLSAGITGAMLLCMQLAIVLT